MIRGTPKIDAVAVGQLEAEFIGPTMNFKAKAAFVDSRTGETHGWTTNNTWSPNTIAKLKELKAAMEEDLGHKHLDGSSQLTEPARAAPEPPAAGLGEFVDGGVEQA